MHREYRPWSLWGLGRARVFGKKPTSSKQTLLQSVRAHQPPRPLRRPPTARRPSRAVAAEARPAGGEPPEQRHPVRCFLHQTVQQYIIIYCEINLPPGASGASIPPPIVTSVHPLPVNSAQRAKILNVQGLVIAFNLMIAFGFVSAFAMVLTVYEKETEVKVQQYINGLSIWAYWLGNFVFDVLMYVVPIVLVLLVLAWFDVKNLVGTDFDALQAFVALMTLFACAMPPFSYLCAHLFKVGTGDCGRDVFVQNRLVLVEFILHRGS